MRAPNPLLVVAILPAASGTLLYYLSQKQTSQVPAKTAQYTVTAFTFVWLITHFPRPQEFVRGLHREETHWDLLEHCWERTQEGTVCPWSWDPSGQQGSGTG